MNALKIVTLSLFLILSATAYSQVNEELKEAQLEKVIETMTDVEEGEIDNSIVLDDLTKISENQLKINTATSEDFEKLNMLDFRQIQNILTYRKQNGFFASQYELATIEGFTPNVIQSVTPFLDFSIPIDSLNFRKKVFNQRIMTRIKTSFPEAIGFRATSSTKGAAYQGIPLSLYNRYNLEIGNKWEFGIIADHDPGEAFFARSNKSGFDYYSGFLAWKSKNIVRQVTIGDFMLRFGQGLNYWSGSGLGKSGEGIGIMKSGQGIRPYTSTDENRFFRGISATIGSDQLKLMLFYSNKRRDANILTDKVTGESYFTSLQTSGYHRTLSEMEDEKTVNEQVIGGYAELKLRKFRAGALFSWQRFSLPMATGSSLYKSFSFSGTKNCNIGFDYQLALRRVQLFGEAGLSKNREPGVVQGLVWHVHPQVVWAFYYRYFNKGFQTFYGSALAESSGNDNESGIYTGLLLYPFPKLKISGYIDIYHFPWLTYSTMSPSSGSDIVAQVSYAFSRIFSSYLKLKVETKPQKVTGTTGVSINELETITKIRCHNEWAINDRFTMRTRFEYAGYSFNGNNENGYLLYHDFVFSPLDKLKIWMRLLWFNTEGYNSRIYTYENDLLYSFSIPEFHGRGEKVYVNLKWKTSSHVTTYFKCGYIVHQGASSWGSGNDLTVGNSRMEIRALVCLKF